MIYKVVFTRTAEEELEHAIDWYNEQLPGLGDRFLVALEETVEVIRHNPETFSVKTAGLRGGAIKRFPYLLIYRISVSRLLVKVLHVFHTARNSG